MQHKKNLQIRTAQHSRQSSISSQGSEQKNKNSSCYIQISPRFNLNGGLAFQNELKEVKIQTPKIESQSPVFESPKLPHRRSIQLLKEDFTKKSRFSKIIHTIDELK